MKQVPSLPQLYVNREGEVFNFRKEKVITSLNSKGFSCIKLKYGKHILIHELITEVYLPKPKVIDGNNIFIKHFDRDKTNNHVDNLIWMTDKWSSIYNILMSKNISQREHIKALKGNEVIYFNNLQETVNYFSIDLKTGWLSLANKKPVKGYTFYYLNIKSREAVKYNIGNGISRVDKNSGADRPIVIFDLLNNTFTCYDRISQASRYLKTSYTSIRSRITTPNKLRFHKKRYLILDDDGKDLTWVIGLLKDNNIIY